MVREGGGNLVACNLCGYVPPKKGMAVFVLLPSIRSEIRYGFTFVRKQSECI